MLLCHLHILKNPFLHQTESTFLFMKFVQFEYFTRRKIWYNRTYHKLCISYSFGIYCKILNWYFSQIAKQKEGPHDDKHTPHHRRMSLYAAGGIPPAMRPCLE